MHIVVVLRLVVDTVEELTVEPGAVTLDTEWLSLKLNEFDDHALEEAVLIKEAHGATVTAIALAADGMDRVLQTALARGADRIVRIDSDGDPADLLDSRRAAATVAAAIEALRPDLVLSGVQTPQDLNGQLVPILGERLGMPHVSGVTGVTPEGNTAKVRQEYGAGRSALLAVELPAVLGIQSASKPPRYVSGTKLREAIARGAPEALSTTPETTAPITVLTLGAREKAGHAEMLDGDAAAVARQILDVLRERNLIGAGT